MAMTDVNTQNGTAKLMSIHDTRESNNHSPNPQRSPPRIECSPISSEDECNTHDKKKLFHQKLKKNVNCTENTEHGGQDNMKTQHK